MKLKILICLLCVWIFSNPTSLQAQITDCRFINYTTADGLVDNFGRVGFVDSRGVLWVGTDDGLASFDGQNFTNYFHNATDSNSITNNFVVDIQEDRSGYLWFSAFDGLARFDPYTGTFKNFHDIPGTNKGLATNRIFNIFIDNDSLFWIGAGGEGFFAYHPNTNTSSKLYTLPGYRWKYKRDTNTPHHFANDPIDSDILWITARNGLYRFNKKTEEILHVIDSEPFSNPKISYSMHHMYFRSPHELWISGWSCGLQRYDTQTGKSKSFYYGEESGLQSSVLDFYAINDSIAWVATQNAGVGFFNFNTGRYRLLPVEPDDPYGMQATNVNTIVPVGNGKVWFVTYGKGISFYDPANQGFSYIKLPADHEIRTTDFAVDTLNKKLYVTGYPINFIAVYTPDGKFLKRIPLEGIHKSKEYNLAILMDHKGEIWAVGNNIYRYKPGDKVAYKFNHPVIDSLEKARPRSYFDIVEDANGNLWIGAINGGIFRIDPNRELVETYAGSGKSKVERFNNLILRDLYLGMDEEVWVVHEYGLTKFNRETNRFKFYPDSIWGRQAKPLTMVQVDKDVFWVSIEKNGLRKLEMKNGELLATDQYTRSDGLPSNIIYSMDIDSKGYIWLGTSKGVVRFNPWTYRIRHYAKDEGLPYTNISGVLKCLDNHTLYVANFMGFGKLRLKANRDTLPPRIRMKKISVFGKPLSLDTLPNFKTGIILDYDQDFFTITFDAVTFSQPDMVEYAYQLKGYDADWVHRPESGNIAIYTGVEPGKYVFMVKAANADRIWSNPQKLAIQIVPPFWQTWWFYLISAFVIIFGLVYLFNLRVKRIRRHDHLKSEFEKQLADMELTALRAQMNPHFIFNCLNSIKHLVVTESNEEATSYLMYFSRLIRMVLNNSAKRRIPLSDELEMVKLYVTMEKLRFGNTFSFKIHTDPALDLESIQIPPLIIQPFVENAIWHGLLHKQGDAHLEIKLWAEAEVLYCTIDDDGIGREKASELKSKSATRKKSYGMKLTGDRLKLFSKLETSQVEIDLKVIDKFDKENKPVGTAVRIKIPLWKF